MTAGTCYELEAGGREQWRVEVSRADLTTSHFSLLVLRADKILLHVDKTSRKSSPISSPISSDDVVRNRGAVQFFHQGVKIF